MPANIDFFEDGSTETAPKVPGQLEQLVAAGVLTREQASEVQAMQSHLARYEGREVSLGALAVEYGFASNAAISQALGAHTDEAHLVPVEVPLHLVRQLQLKPAGLSQAGVFYVASLLELTKRDKQDLIDACWRLDSEIVRVEQVSVDPKEVLAYLRAIATDKQTLTRLVDAFNSDPSNRTQNEVMEGIVHEAVQERASDIHLVADLDIKECRVSYRLDSLLHRQYLLTPRAAQVLMAHVKSAAQMDAGVTRQAQDGRISRKVATRKIDIRAATLPTSSGERLTLRLLDPAERRTLPMQLRESPAILERVLPYARTQSKTMPGIFLVTGPTGQGKSSVMYGFVYELNRLGRTIYTAEDPVEQRLPLVTQTNVSAAHGLDFSEILRRQLRMDPDVLIMGEIRDQLTAETALRSAESGHFVAGTLHASSCEESVQRYLNLLPAHFRSQGELNLSAYLRVVLNLQLVPRVCSCASRHRAAEIVHREAARQKMGLEADDEVLLPKGCPRCRDTGYYGRVLLPEALMVSSEVSVRKELLEVISGRTRGLISEVAGVEHYARLTAVRKLLLSQQLDIRTAASAAGELI